MSMFCNQCQETAKNAGCSIAGVCGKKEPTANIQDLLVFACQGLAMVTTEARKKGISVAAESRHITNCLFMTITNANFDDKAIISAIRETATMRDNLQTKVNVVSGHESLSWIPSSDEELYIKAARVGTLTYDSDPDIRSLKQYVLFGIKGMAAYAEHAFNLGYEEDGIFR